MSISIYSYAIGLSKETANKEISVNNETEAAYYIESRISEIEDDENNGEPDMYFFVKDSKGNEINVF